MKTKSERDELRRLAREATPGPWQMQRSRHRGTEGNERLTGHMGGRLDGPRYVPHYEDSILVRRDARYIAAANPVTVLALLDRIDELEAALAKADEELEQHR